MIDVERLLFDDENEAHIACHGFTPDDVREAVETGAFAERGRGGLTLVWGRTASGLPLLVVLAPRARRRYYVVTARRMTDRERRRYNRRRKR